MAKLYDLTNPQKSIWLTEEFYNGTSMENITGSVIISEKVNFKLLEKAINLFVKNNDSCRLKFIKTTDGVKQFFEEFKDFPIEVIDVSADKDIEKLEKGLSKTPFNILDSVLYIFKLFKFPDGHGGFTVSIHHLISDAWTGGLVIDGIINIYATLSKNPSCTTFDFPSYMDYISSEQEYLSSTKFNKDKSFWENKFKEVPEIACIPSANTLNGSAPVSCVSKRKIFKFPKETLEKINEFTKKYKSSPFNFFMGVFALYLGRVSNLDEFVIGTPILNRGNFKEKHTTGMFICTVPFKVTINHEVNFSEFISGISSDFFDVFRHQKYPYQYLLETLRKENGSVPNLYDVMLSYQNMRNSKQSSEIDFTSSWVHTNYTADSLDIHFFDVNDTGVINVAYDYRTAKYTIEDICAIHARILHIINQILENENIKLKEIEIVTPDEKNEILYKFNNTKMDYPKDKTISELFEEQVEKTPDNIAVVFEDEQLTYKELNEKANSLAHYLRDNGIGRNDIVGIMVNRSLEMIISILAVLKSGGCYIPIDPEYPQDRIEYMLDNSNAKLLLTFNKLDNKIKFANKVFVELTNKEIYSLANINLENINSPEDLSYVIYTSGSTGKPKGVMLLHKSLSNLTNYCNNYVAYLKNNTYKTIVSITTVSFDIFIFETLISLQKGLKLVIANESEQTIPRLLNSLIEKHNVEMIQATPSRMKLLVNSITDIPNLKNLKFITLAGEQLPKTLVDELKDICNPTIYNGYGPSETTVFSTLTDVTNHEEITIGKPLDNTYIYILDKNLSVVPNGISGEIYIGGEGVGKGYLNNITLTNKSYLNSPFMENSLLYKSGDLGIYKNNGEILCLGRCDNQVKIRGLRIELGEIEEKILEYESIKNCVVIKTVISEHEYLCAYYNSSCDMDINSLRTFLSKVLPNYMVPSYFMQLEKLPYTPNGKIDRKKLPTPEVISSKEIISSRNSTDLTLISILKDLLNIDSISIDDSFFDLGGDSLSAINLCTQVYKKFNVEISVKDIVENPVILNLSDIVSNKLGKSNIVLFNIPKIKSSSNYTISSAQKRMYYSSTMAGENSILYNLPGGIILDKLPDIKKLENCFNILIDRHEAFRTYFELDGDNVVQKIKEKTDFKIDIAERIISSDNLKLEFDSFAKPFDLSKSPLLRAKFIKLDNKKCALFVDMHHIISDGTSLSIFINELCKLYNDKSLEKLSITYKDFSAWENNKLTSGEFKEAEDFWVNQFKDDIPVLNMPTNYTRPAVKSYEGSKVHNNLDSTTTIKINNICKELGVTPYMFLLSVYYILLSKYSSQDDIIVGSPIVGRNSAELYNVIGMFVNTLPIRAKIDSSSTFRDFLNNVKNICLENYKYQDYPLDQLVNKLNIPKDTSRNPLFDTMFIYQNNGNTAVNFDGIKSEYYIPDTKISKFDLSLEIIPENDILNLSFEYCTKLFNKDFIKNMSCHYSNVLNTVLDNLDVQLSTICMLSDDEKHKILYEFNDTKMDYPKDKTIAQLFEEQVEKTPDNIAVVFEDEQLTYRELNEKSNSLAHYLREKGIGRNDIVGIMVNRSLEMIISILAVLKSGGAYLLIDNTFPSDRIEYMLNNCNAKLLLTDSEYSISFNNKILLNNLSTNNNFKNPKNVNSSKDSFAIIYTSGSTGKPKGVILHHTGIINLAYSFDKLMNFSSMKSHLGFSSVSFDMFAVELFSSILLGRTLFLLNSEEQKNPILMSKKIIENNISFLITTPTKIELLLSNSETALCLKTLKGFQLGGEVFTPSLYEKLRQYTNAKIYNGYGPTEITACCSNKLITSKDNINIGSPNPNTKIYILNKEMNVCPLYVPGEIYVGGTGVGKGYINDSEKTSKSFLNNTFDSDIIYRTGDIGFFNKNGEVEYIGRNDFQVKLKGLRIELSEIEKQFLAIKYINNCVILTDSNKTYLKAFFTASEELNIPNIREQLSEVLPRYMIPNYIFQIESIPMTSNGKVDRKKLDEYKCEICDNNVIFVEPENDLQKLFCKIWEDILQTKVGIDNDLFELGADSLSAIKFKVEALNNNIDIPYSDIFKYKTIRKLSEQKSKAIETTPIENYDYSNINTILKSNKTRLNYNIQSNKNNNILLLGSNGFVGMHIIESFIKNDSGKIYCMMRDKNNKSAIDRFKEISHFYFGNSLDQFIDKRIFIVKGDIIKENFGLSSSVFQNIIDNVSIVINSAANVKHFGNFEKFKSINIDSTIRIIEFCKTYSKRLLHLSTLSVSGNMFLDGSMPLKDIEKIKKIYFSENNLFIKQSLDNVYTRSKFEAEKIILDNIYLGLDAQILRLGNITSRYSDGVFQINPNDNAFTNRFKSIILLGVLPKSLLEQEVEFTPVDLCSDSIIKIMQNNSRRVSVVHLYNYNHIKINKILKILNNLGIKISVETDEDFKITIKNSISNSKLKKKVNGIINDLSSDKKLKYSSNIKIKSDLSIDYLSKCKFRWKRIDSTYIEKFLKYLQKINFFEEE